jgi:hypothetical protein
VGLQVQLLCLELRRYGPDLTQLAEAGLQSRERREVQLPARSLPLLLCPRVLAAGCCTSLLRAPSAGRASTGRARTGRASAGCGTGAATLAPAAALARPR